MTQTNFYHIIIIVVYIVVKVVAFVPDGTIVPSCIFFQLQTSDMPPVYLFTSYSCNLLERIFIAKGCYGRDCYRQWVLSVGGGCTVWCLSSVDEPRLTAILEDNNSLILEIKILKIPPLQKRGEGRHVRGREKAGVEPYRKRLPGTCLF